MLTWCLDQQGLYPVQSLPLSRVPIAPDPAEIYECQVIFIPSRVFLVKQLPDVEKETQQGGKHRVEVCFDPLTSRAGTTGLAVPEIVEPTVLFLEGPKMTQEAGGSGGENTDGGASGDGEEMQSQIPGSLDS